MRRTILKRALPCLLAALLLNTVFVNRAQEEAVTLPLASPAEISAAGGDTALPADQFTTASDDDGTERTGPLFTTEPGQFIRFPAVGLSPLQGEINLWYRPNYDAASEDDTIHALVVVGEVYGAPRIELFEGDRLGFNIIDPDFNFISASAAYRAPLWVAGDWVNIRAVWDSTAEDPIQLYVNEERVDEGSSTRTWDFEAAYDNLFIGSANLAGDFPADGLLADVRVSAAAPVAAVPPADAGDEVTFSLTLVDNAFRHGQGLEVVDLDADDDLDILLASSLNDAVYLYLNDGAAAFTRFNVAAENTIVAMQTASADFNGDGDLDVAAVGLFDRSCAFCAPGEVVWYANPGASGDATWTENTIAPRLWGARSIAAADIDGDGDPDVVVGTVQVDGNGGGLYWYQNRGAEWDGPLPIGPDLAYVESLRVTDVNGDALPDVLVTSTGGDVVLWYENLGAIPEVLFRRRTLGEAVRPYGMALLPGDADTPAALIVTSDDGVLRFDPGADVTEPWARTTIDADYGVNGSARVAVVDLNGDGLEDLAITSNNRGAGRTDFRWYQAGADGSWSPQDITPAYPGLTDVAGGDFNGDGRADLIGSTYSSSGSSDQLPLWLNEPS